MALEVGKIVARIEGETAQFEKSMGDAARTFEVTARKLDASAQQLANNLKKTYSERVVAANAAANREIEAAQRSMRERLRATTSSAEVAAVREQFSRRAEAARAGARQEVQAAQQQYLAASENLRPIIATTGQMTQTTSLATAQLSKLRTATVAVANAAAGANPIFAQTSAVIGAMVGTGGVVALAVAAITALGFAYNRATKDARELKEEQKKLNDQLEREGRGRVGLIAGAENAERDAAVKRLAQITAELAAARQPQFRFTEDPRSGIRSRELVDNSAEIVRLSQEYARLSRVAVAVDGKRADEANKIANEATRAAEAFDQLVESGKEINRELTESLAKLIEIADEAALATLQRFRLGDLVSDRDRRLITRPSVTTTAPRTVAALGPVVTTGGQIVTETDRWASQVKKAAASMGDVLSDSVKRVFDPRQILSGLATGGLAALSGELLNFGAELLGLSNKAREAARQMREAQRSWSRTLDDFIRSFAPDRQRQEGDFVSQLQDLARDMFEAFGKIKPTDPRAQQFVQLQKMLDTAGSLTEVISILNLIKALFPEFAAQIDKMIQAAGLAAGSLNETAKAAQKVAESLTNVPIGIKEIARLRFNATAPALPVVPTPPRTGGPIGPWRWTPGQGQAVYNVTGPITVTGVEDVPAFIDKLETEIARKKLRGGSGISLDYL